MPMKNPPHPGSSVRHDCIEPPGLTTTAAAKILGVTRQTLNNLINGKERNFSRNGNPPRQGFRRRRGNMVVRPDGLRSRVGPQAREANSGCPARSPHTTDIHPQDRVNLERHGGASIQ